MNIFSTFKLKNKYPDASPLYFKIVRQARLPVFYENLGIPDTASGRFDLIALHAFIVMKRLKGTGTDGGNLSQALFDYMFVDLDKNLREMGVGDLAVGKKIKKLAAAYYGRVKAYDVALQNTDVSLEAALKRNIYLDSNPSSQQLSAMVNYVRDLSETSNSWSLEQIIKVSFDFQTPPNTELLINDY